MYIGNSTIGLASLVSMVITQSFFFLSLGTTSFLPSSSSSIFPSSPTFFLPYSAAHHSTPVQNAIVATALVHLSPSSMCTTSRQHQNVTVVTAEEDHCRQANAHLHICVDLHCSTLHQNHVKLSSVCAFSSLCVF